MVNPKNLVIMLCAFSIIVSFFLPWGSRGLSFVVMAAYRMTVH